LMIRRGMRGKNSVVMGGGRGRKRCGGMRGCRGRMRRGSGRGSEEGKEALRVIDCSADGVWEKSCSAFRREERKSVVN
jgi:hypothetical protein